MYDEGLFKNVVAKYINELALEHNATSIYLVGSFSTTNMWTLGMSDIDLKVITSGQTSHGSIDITEEVFEYYERYACDRLFDRMKNNKEEVVLSYTVWNIDKIKDEFAWECFYHKRDLYNSMIITDQLMLLGEKELIYGEEIDFSPINPITFRTYMNAMSSNFQQIKRGYSILSEIKIIIYAVRIFNYLWTGKYIYNYDSLHQSVIDNNYDSLIILVLKDAIDLRKKINSGSVNTNVTSDEYFILTRKMMKERKRIIKYLLMLDEEFCKTNGYRTIGIESIVAQGAIV